MEGEGEQVEAGQGGREVDFAVAEIVFEIVAVVLENIEGFVFDFPSCAATRREVDDGVWTDGEIGDEAVAICGLSGRVDDFDSEPGECQYFCVWGVFSLTESQVHNYIWRVSV